MDSQLQDLADKAVNLAQDSGCHYCDIRAESVEKSGFLIENGQVENSGHHADRGIGIRVLHLGAWGFYSISNPQDIQQIRDAVNQAKKSAEYSSQNKKNKVILQDNPAHIDDITYPLILEPNLDELVKIGKDCNEIMTQRRVIKKMTSISYSKVSKYFTSSIGAKITQNYTDTIADLQATAHESGLTQSVNITEGGRGGLEKLTKQNDIFAVAKEISQKASKLIDAKPIKEEKTTLVMNPDFVSLLTHEILGHPSEADRVLGKEMAWAGGAWWAGKLGEKIGSDALSVFDDPTIHGNLGWYDYDDEGVKSSKTNLIKDGVLINHFQSLETAKTFDTHSTANMRATTYRFMPLIRMACTCIAPGDHSPEEMIRDVKDGYLIHNMKIPSIDMKRYNWSISAQYAQKIENGELGELKRDVIVTGIAPDFFASIDACGDDFQVRPITNCGKGDPMQSMMMGNGGPSIRGVATVKGGN